MPQHLQHRAAVTVREFSELMGVSYHHAWALCNTGRIPTFRLGGKILIPKEYVETLIDSAYDEEVPHG
jgi:excisionase family DNA binding protein